MQGYYITQKAFFDMQRGHEVSTSSLLLITEMDSNLKESRIAIQVTKVKVPCQSLQHFKNKREMKMIFLGGFI